MNLIICDIDGVLADCSHRLHYLKEKNYDVFYSNVMLDDLRIVDGAKLLYCLWNRRVSGDDLHEKCNAIIFLTGRPCKTRDMTKTWISSNLVADLNRYPILMRGDGDYRPSPTVKVELLKTIAHTFTEYNTVYFIDDDPENVKAVCKAFPQVTGITFGVKRMEEK